MADPSASPLSEQQRKVFVDVVTALCRGWSDALEDYFENDEVERKAELMFLAGWVGAVEAQREKR